MRQALETDRAEHHKNAENAREELKKKKKESKQDGSKLLAFTFDLQKTQPIPYLRTSIVFYLRQLWMYNLVINLLSENKGYMCLWQETEARRGSCEVRSAVLPFLESSCDLTKYEAIHTFSDSCGGQNRNKNIISMFMLVCQTTNVKEWTHTFLESGHSYLPNDTDFGKIEKEKRKQLKIESFSQWKELIKQCKFEIIEMGGKFKDINQIQKNLTFRNMNSDKEKFSWLNVKSLRVEKANPGVMYYKCTHDPGSTFKTIDFNKKKLCANG